MKDFLIAAAFLVIFSYSSFAQTPQKMEQDLSQKLDVLMKNSTYSGNYDENLIEKAQTDFKNTLLKYVKNAETLKYSFPKLRERIFIQTSADGKFRVYSWDTEDGGTMHNFDEIYQYRADNGKVFVKSRADGENEGASFVAKIYQLNTKDGAVYLTINSSIASTQDAAQSVNALKIVGDKLDDTVKIFKTKEGFTNTIGFAYNFFSVMERPERPILLISFDAKTNILKIPVVIENEKYPNGEVTSRFINYKFDGKNFVKAN